MNSAIERLLTLRVSDVMTRNVVTIAGTKIMSEAADVLTQNFISGAPVVGQQGQCALNDQGRPAGVLTSLDIVAALINAIEE